MSNKKAPKKSKPAGATPFTYRCPDDLHAILIKEADKDDRRLNEQVTHLLKLGLAAKAAGWTPDPST